LPEELLEMTVLDVLRRGARFLQSASNSPTRLLLRTLRLSHGKGCYFHRSVTWSLATLDRIRLGSLVGIHKGCCVFIPIHAKQGSITIGDGVSIGDGSRLYAEGPMWIGDGCLISTNVFISDSSHNLEPHHRFVSRSGMSFRKAVFVGENCFIGRNSTLLPGTRLGNNCTVGANCIVRGDFPDGSTLVSPLATTL
jgi:acetyltransferase-like isoleucine patch superfamily enzyme